MTNNSITPGAVAIAAHNAMMQHGLVGWTFKFNTNKRRAGVCKFRTKRIELSIHLLSHGWKHVEDTILHEIAHALVGRRHNHDVVWKAKAREIGCSGDRCLSLDGGVRMVEPRWVGTCPVCQKKFKAHKRKIGSFHGDCNQAAVAYNRRIRAQRRAVRRDPLAAFFPYTQEPVSLPVVREIVWTQNPEYREESRVERRRRRRHLRDLTRTVN